MSLNTREVFEALLAGETLQDVNDSKMQIRLDGDWVVDADDDVVDDPTLLFWEIKPKVININGYEVPEPVREPLADETIYWLVDICSSPVSYRWSRHEADYRCLEAGLIHLTKEAAELHRTALLSFTAKPQP